MNLITVAPNLWIANQPLRFFGLEVGSRMVLVKLPSQDLVLISPIELNQADLPTFDQLGSVRHIIAPNLFHHLSIGSAKVFYPEAKVWGVAGLPEKRPDLTFDTLLTEPGSFEGVLDYLQFQGFVTIFPNGIKSAQETVFLHRPSRTLILTDIAFNFDETNSPSTRLVGWIGGTYKALKPSRLEKWGTRDKASVELSLRQILEWDFDRVIPGHGSIVETGGKAQLKEGYEWFLSKAL